MPEECVILFLHYRNDDLTRHHLSLIRTLNPEHPVIPIHHGVADPVAGSIDVGTDPQFACERRGGRDAWKFCDAKIYQWWRRNPGVARRIVALESDTLATMPVREFYGDLWNSPAAASVVITPESDPSWIWWPPAEPIPLDLLSFAGGVGPMSGLLLTDDTLRAVTESPMLPSRVISELRLGTMLRYLGIPVSPFPADRTMDVQCSYTTVDPSRPSIYHPVKT